MRVTGFTPSPPPSSRCGAFAKRARSAATALARRAALGVVAISAGASVGCSLDWSFESGSSSGSSGTGSSSGGSSGGSSSGASGSSGSGGDGGGGEASAPVDAGPVCTANGDCAAGEICHYGDHQCNKAQPGHCQTIRTDCPTGTSPAVCSCDGTVDDDECVANGRGQDLSSEAACAAPGFRYRCGDLFCVTGTPFSEFCIRQNVAGEDTFRCENAFDFSCSTPSCSGCDDHGCACSALSGGALLVCP